MASVEQSKFPTHPRPLEAKVNQSRYIRSVEYPTSPVTSKDLNAREEASTKPGLALLSQKPVAYNNQSEFPAHFPHL